MLTWILGVIIWALIVWLLIAISFTTTIQKRQLALSQVYAMKATCDTFFEQLMNRDFTTEDTDHFMYNIRSTYDYDRQIIPVDWLFTFYQSVLRPWLPIKHTLFRISLSKLNMSKVLRDPCLAERLEDLNGRDETDYRPYSRTLDVYFAVIIGIGVVHKSDNWPAMLDQIESATPIPLYRIREVLQTISSSL